MVHGVTVIKRVFFVCIKMVYQRQGTNRCDTKMATHIRPLIAFVDGQYRVDEETATWLSQRTKPFSVLACAGKFRTGKSFLLNRLLNRPAGKGFGVGETVQACTRGIWLCMDMMSHNGNDVLVLDTEGIDALDAESQHDVRIFAIAVLICSAFAYNSMSHLDEAAVQTLSLMTKISQSLEGGGHDPSLYWVLRDFSLQMVDSDGKALKNTEYLEQALQPPAGSEKCATRDAIRSVFRERNLVTLPRPHRGESAQKLDAKGSSGISPKFERFLNIFRDHICDHTRKYTVNGIEVGGAVYVEHVRNIVRMINEDGAIPKVEDTWTLLARAQQTEVFSGIQEAMRAVVETEWTVPHEEGEARTLLRERVMTLFERARFLTSPAEDAEITLDRILNETLAYATGLGRIKRSADIAREWVEGRIESFSALRPDALLDDLPESDDVARLVRHQLLSSLAGGALYTKIVDHAREQVTMFTTGDIERLRHENETLRDELERKKDAVMPLALVDKVDACTDTEGLVEDVEARSVTTAVDSEAQRMIDGLEGMLADNESRITASDERARVLEERNRLLHETFDETMNAMREEVVDAERDRDTALTERDRVVEQKRALGEELTRMHSAVKESQDKTVEVHKSMLDELKRRDAEQRTLSESHFKEVSEIRVEASVSTNENRMLKRRVDELLVDHEEAKRLKTSLQQVSVERAREDTERDNLKRQNASLRTDVESMRSANVELENRMAVLTATAKLESFRRSSVTTSGKLV